MDLTYWNVLHVTSISKHLLTCPWVSSTAQSHTDGEFEQSWMKAPKLGKNNNLLAYCKPLKVLLFHLSEIIIFQCAAFSSIFFFTSHIGWCICLLLILQFSCISVMQKLRDLQYLGYILLCSFSLTLITNFHCYIPLVEHLLYSQCWECPGI